MKKKLENTTYKLFKGFVQEAAEKLLKDLEEAKSLEEE